MSYCDDIVVGDLVCIKSWSMDDQGSGWISLPSDFGIVVEIIEVEHNFVFIDHKIRCFDYVVYWITEGKLEILPDIIVEKFSNWEVETHEKRLC